MRQTIVNDVKMSYPLARYFIPCRGDPRGARGTKGTTGLKSSEEERYAGMEACADYEITDVDGNDYICVHKSTFESVLRHLRFEAEEAAAERKAIRERILAGTAETPRPYAPSGSPDAEHLPYVDENGKLAWT